MAKETSEVYVIQIGKNGVTDQILSEIRKQLRKKKALKVRILKSALGETDKYGIAEEVSSKSGGILVDVRGNTFTLKRK